MCKDTFLVFFANDLVFKVNAASPCLLSLVHYVSKDYFFCKRAFKEKSHYFISKSTPLSLLSVEVFRAL